MLLSRYMSHDRSKNRPIFIGKSISENRTDRNTQFIEFGSVRESVLDRPNARSGFLLPIGTFNFLIPNFSTTKFDKTPILRDPQSAQEKNRVTLKIEHCIPLN